MKKHQLDETRLSIYFTQISCVHVSGEISPIIRSYKTVKFRYGIIVHKYVRRYDVVEYFDVLLTVHYSNDQFWLQPMHHNFTLLTKSLYMFRAPTCPSSGGRTIRTPQLVQLHLL